MTIDGIKKKYELSDLPDDFYDLAKDKCYVCKEYQYINIHNRSICLYCEGLLK